MIINRIRANPNIELNEAACECTTESIYYDVSLKFDSVWVFDIKFELRDQIKEDLSW